MNIAVLNKYSMIIHVFILWQNYIVGVETPTYNYNYKIYHTIDDYLVNKEQLVQLKEYAGNNLVLLNNGSHLGFLYRNEFLAELKHEIAKNKRIIAVR